MKIAVSINPTYECNLNCNFCYLKNLHTTKTLNLDELKNTLQYISSLYEFEYIDIYGGEITLLTEDYINELLTICEHYTQKISLMSNFVKLPSWIYNISYPIGSSWDYESRGDRYKILNNIETYYRITNKKVPILLCDPKNYYYKEEILELLNRDCIDSFSVIPCMKTIHNNIDINFQQYEEMVKYFIEHKIKPMFVNEMKLTNDREMYKHIFITPNNEIVDVYYNNNIESFKPIDISNKSIIIPNQCLICKNFNKCQNEHIEHYINDGYDCNGFSKLIDWYKERNNNAINH